MIYCLNPESSSMAHVPVGRGSAAPFSNLFRYNLLHKKGGQCVDADVVCLSETVRFAEIFMSWEYEHLIGNLKTRQATRDC
jgi:hypothetical protein